MSSTRINPPQPAYFCRTGLVKSRAHIAPHKEEKMVAIAKALEQLSVEHPVFYEDEVYIHLNPKIGTYWQLRGQQKRIAAPARMKNIIWLVRYIAVKEKSAMSEEAVKIRVMLPTY